MKDKNGFFSRLPVVLAGTFICCFLWGSAFPCIKIGYGLWNIASGDYASQILFAGTRFTLAGLMVILYLCIRSHSMVLPAGSSWGMIVRLSMLQTVGQYICFYIGLANTLGVRASIVQGASAFMTTLVGALVFKMEKLNTGKIVGCLLGFAGVFIMNVTGNDVGSGFYWGDLLVFAAVSCYAFSGVFLKRYSEKEDAVILSGYQFLTGGVIMVIIGLLLGGRFTEVTVSGVLMLIYLAFISAMAYSLWGVLLRYNPVSRISVFGFMNPMFGFILSALLLGEGSVMGIGSVISIVLICVGIFTVNRAGRTEQPAQN